MRVLGGCWRRDLIESVPGFAENRAEFGQELGEDALERCEHLLEVGLIATQLVPEALYERLALALLRVM